MSRVQRVRDFAAEATAQKEKHEAEMKAAKEAKIRKWRMKEVKLEEMSFGCPNQHFI